MRSYTEADLRQALAHSADDAAPPTDVWSGLQRRIVRRRRMRAGAVVVGAAILISGAAVAVPRLGDTDKVSPADGDTSILTPDRPLSDAELQQAVDILRQRIDALGINGATVTTHDGGVAVTAPDATPAAVASIAQPGQLQLRQVLEEETGGGAELSHPAVAAVRDLTAAKHVLAGQPCTEATTGKPQPTLVTSYLVTCSSDGAIAYLLGPAALDNGDVDKAHALLDPASNQWAVEVDLDAAGATKFFDLSARAGQADPAGTSTDCAPPQGCNGIAMLVDGVVLSAPSVLDPNGIRGGNVQINGALTEAEARGLAASATTEPLPSGFTVNADAG